MARPSARPRPQRRPRRVAPSSRRAQIPIARPAFLLPIVAFLLALGLQPALKSAGLESTNPLRVFLTPLVAAAVVFFGLRSYPMPSRIRLAAMVAIVLFLFVL